MPFDVYLLMSALVRAEAARAAAGAPAPEPPTAETPTAKTPPPVADPVVGDPPGARAEPEGSPGVPGASGAGHDPTGVIPGH
ncbi:hypothetical protein ACFRCG_46490 [Embleya sp. NPDC056575]|uniref:hypothetical protein n=1 Tax=Embleya sp. NPDC056575 TaxID=3345869 RepID=UPI0036B01C19